MTPIHYIMSSQDVDTALSSGCLWIQIEGHADEEILKKCHDAGSYCVLTDDVPRCKEIAADGVVLTPKAIERLAAEEQEPTGIVFQRALPISLVIGSVRRTLGEDTPQMLGVVATTDFEAIAAAKAGADFIQVYKENCLNILKAVRGRSFTTPIVAIGVTETEEICPLLDEGISGISCHIKDVPPILFPSFLTADEI